MIPWSNRASEYPGSAARARSIAMLASAPSTGLPGGEGQQRGGGREVSRGGAPDDVGPQAQVRGPVPGIHPRPGVVPDREVGQDDREPGHGLVGCQAAALPVRADRLMDGAPSLVHQQPRRAPRPRAGCLGDEVRGTFPGPARGLLHGPGGVAGGFIELSALLVRDAVASLLRRVVATWSRYGLDPAGRRARQGRHPGVAGA